MRRRVWIYALLLLAPHAWALSAEAIVGFWMVASQDAIVQISRTCDCRVWLSDDGDLQLRGFFGTPILGTTTTWTRVEAPI